MAEFFRPGGQLWNFYDLSLKPEVPRAGEGYEFAKHLGGALPYQPALLAYLTKELPVGFQRTEFLFEHGFVDRIVQRRALRNELKDTGITVTCLMPGVTDTEFFRRADLLDTKVGADDEKMDPAEVARIGFKAMMDGEGDVIAGLLWGGFLRVFVKVSVALQRDADRLRRLLHRQAYRERPGPPRPGRRVRQQFAQGGIDSVLNRKQRATPPVPPIFDGEKEARLIALACSQRPDLALF